MAKRPAEAQMSTEGKVRARRTRKRNTVDSGWPEVEQRVFSLSPINVQMSAKDNQQQISMF